MEIRPDQIDPDALRVVQRLRRHQHKAYVVGGCVRDLLLGRKPKDFDVATSATPSEIRRCFRNCRIIGRRFRLAHVFFGRKIIETATFRANPRAPEDENGDAPVEEKAPDLLIRRDNVFGTEEEDARRRDFTINGLFFDVETAQVIDHVGGLPDLEARLVRTIGDPDIRFREDPVRILRAVKFAARCDLTIEPETYRRMMEHKADLAKCAQARVTEEFYRLLRAGAARRSFELLVETGLLEVLLPELAQAWRSDEPEARKRVERFWAYLQALDESIVARAETPSDALILATLLLPPLRDILAPNEQPAQSISQVVALSVRPVLERLKASRRDSESSRQILLALRYLLPGDRHRRQHHRLANRSFYQDALWLVAIVTRAEGLDPPLTVDNAATEAADPGIQEEELPPELLIDVEGPPARDGRERRGRRERGGRIDSASPAAVEPAPEMAPPAEIPDAWRPETWQPGPAVRTPIPSLDGLPCLPRPRPAFLGCGTFGGRWATPAD
ncbi:MAG: polynucleotide adenylyltransferase PcnB [Deltaproteobacteria bacterium]|nr:polynucleotide adenylyltransferase PcnB [Deltaproteobacteria bacterium]